MTWVAHLMPLLGLIAMLGLKRRLLRIALFVVFVTHVGLLFALPALQEESRLRGDEHWFVLSDLAQLLLTVVTAPFYSLCLMALPEDLSASWVTKARSSPMSALLRVEECALEAFAKDSEWLARIVRQGGFRVVRREFSTCGFFTLIAFESAEPAPFRMLDGLAARDPGEGGPSLILWSDDCGLMLEGFFCECDWDLDLERWRSVHPEQIIRVRG